MKNEKLRELVETAQNSHAVWRQRLGREGGIELTAIWKENTAKDKQIAGLITAAKIGLSYAIEGCVEHYGESRTKTRKHRGWPQDHLDLIVSIEAAIALQAPTSKVLIDIEKIREIHNELIIEAEAIGEGDATVGIVGLEERSELCALITFLGDILKEVKNA